MRRDEASRESRAPSPTACSFDGPICGRLARILALCPRACPVYDLLAPHDPGGRIPDHTKGAAMRSWGGKQIMIVVAAGWVATPAPAQAPKEQFWGHKEWRSTTETTKAGKTCNTSTGGDGDPRFVVSVQPGGLNGAIYFEEQGVRGHATRMRKNDDILFKFDGKASKAYGNDILVHVGVGSDGIPEASATLVSSLMPEVTRVMRSSSSLTVLRENPRKKQQEVLHKFSLEGFTANFLKLAEWCKFNPDKMFQS